MTHDTDGKRARARALLDLTPDAGLDEAVETLATINEFWSTPIEPWTPVVVHHRVAVLVPADVRPEQIAEVRRLLGVEAIE